MIINIFWEKGEAYNAVENLIISLRHTVADNGLPHIAVAPLLMKKSRRKEPITAATWFWATDKLDAGDICEQEIIKIDYNLRPKV